MFALQNPVWVFHISRRRLHTTTLRVVGGGKNSFMADFLLTFGATPPVFVSRLFMVSYCLPVLLPICLHDDLAKPSCPEANFQRVLCLKFPCKLFRKYVIVGGCPVISEIMESEAESQKWPIKTESLVLHEISQSWT